MRLLHKLFEWKSACWCIYMHMMIYDDASPCWHSWQFKEELWTCDRFLTSAKFCLPEGMKIEKISNHLGFIRYPNENIFKMFFPWSICFGFMFGAWQKFLAGTSITFWSIWFFSQNYFHFDRKVPGHKSHGAKCHFWFPKCFQIKEKPQIHHLLCLTFQNPILVEK